LELLAALAFARAAGVVLLNLILDLLGLCFSLAPTTMPVRSETVVRWA